MAENCPCCDEKDTVEVSPKDMQQIVDKVYALFLRDLKIERERRQLRPRCRVNAYGWR